MSHGGDGWSTWPVVARIWQTVDVERTVAALGLSPEPIDDDAVLGARGVLVRPPEGPPVAVLEPATEGRLAGALARHDEGDAGFYVAPNGGVDKALATGFTLLAEGDGPFGRSALVGPPGGQPSPRFIVIVAPPPATIAR